LTVIQWSFFLMLTGMILAIIVISGILSSAMDAQVPDLTEEDFEAVPGSPQVYRARSDGSSLGTMTISITLEDGERKTIGIVVKEGNSRIFDRDGASIPLSEILTIKSGGDIEITLTLVEDSFSFSDLTIRISVPSTIPFAFTVCGIFTAPACCLIWIASLTMAIMGMIEMKRIRGGIR
jgi:hypothetical protein